MNDLNFAGLIAARQAATQARQTGETNKTQDSRDAASAFDAVMARASRTEAARSAEAVADARRARQPEAVRKGETKPQAPAQPRQTQGAGTRDTMADRTRAQGEGETAAPESTKSASTDTSCSDTKTAPNPQDAAAIVAGLPVTAAPVQSVLETPTNVLETQSAAATAEAGAAGVQAGFVAAAPTADEPDLESLSTVIRSDDPLADALETPRGLARALPPDEATAATRTGPAKAAQAAHGAGHVAHAAPFERVIEAAQRESAALREFSAAGAKAGTAEASAPARVDGSMPSAQMFAPAAPATYSVAHGSVSAPLGQPAFAEEFAQRVVMFTSQKVHNAQIALTPAELGPISIGIEMRGQEAHLTFNAAHATTRAAIEDALPRLRDMFEASGLQLANAHVGDQATQRDYGRSRRGSEAAGLSSMGAAASSGGSNTAASIDAQAMRTHWLRSDRLIDIVV